MHHYLVPSAPAVQACERGRYGMPYNHRIRVRYDGCDQHGVVFNAHHMAYTNNAAKVRVRRVAPDGDHRNFGREWMVVRRAIESQDSARNADVLSIDVGVVRCGDTSFDPGFPGRVAQRPVFAARRAQVSVTPVTLGKMPTPDRVRARPGPAESRDVPV